MVGNFLNQLKAPNVAERLLAPLAVFDVYGRVYAELFAFLKVDLWFLEIDKKFEITPEIEILNFEIPFYRPPVLATEMDNGDLILNMGSFAKDRLRGVPRISARSSMSKASAQAKYAYGRIIWDLMQASNRSTRLPERSLHRAAKAMIPSILPG